MNDKSFCHAFTLFCFLFLFFFLLFFFYIVLLFFVYSTNEGDEVVVGGRREAEDA